MRGKANPAYVFDQFRQIPFAAQLLELSGERVPSNQKRALRCQHFGGEFFRKRHSRFSQHGGGGSGFIIKRNRGKIAFDVLRKYGDVKEVGEFVAVRHGTEGDPAPGFFRHIGSLPVEGDFSNFAGCERSVPMRRGEGRAAGNRNLPRRFDLRILLAVVGEEHGFRHPLSGVIVVFATGEMLRTSADAGEERRERIAKIVPQRRRIIETPQPGAVRVRPGCGNITRREILQRRNRGRKIGVQPEKRPDPIHSIETPGTETAFDPELFHRRRHRIDRSVPDSVFFRDVPVGALVP
ncbi:hypothetical protein SDC9_154427 [bioreactor metagenome]|uniref:Uncharacterized protein n=1 Tax=bioreactor metagenome TaxID=1076179 RepID=A0A645EYQ4_9ZZZZ